MGLRKSGPRKDSPALAHVERGKPEGLTVEFLPVPNGEFVLFSWNAAASAGAASLTAAERDVLRHILEGATNEAIASARGTSVRTVANQVAALLRKTGAGSRFDLIRCFADAVSRSDR
jgi:DNA-binding CsgD family transcriptional regulator